MKRFIRNALLLTLFGLAVTALAPAASDAGLGQNPVAAVSPEYAAIQKSLARGWNTWDTASMLTHVLLPDGLALRLQLKNEETGETLEAAFAGGDGPDEARVRPGRRSYDGSYTELQLNWRGIGLRVESAASGDDLAILVSTEPGSKTGALIVKPEMFYGRDGQIESAGDALNIRLPSKEIRVFINGAKLSDGAAANAPAPAFSLEGAVGVSVNAKRSAGDIEKIIAAARQKIMDESAGFGELSDVHDAMQSVLAWNTIYEPTRDRVIAPVSRRWSAGWGGYVLFDWDTYFAAYMLSMDSRELAYANAIEVTKGITDAGFVPNYAAARNGKSLDRSQPPVGSLVVREIYRRYREKWLLRLLFEDLLKWNRWWEANRTTDGYLCWGSQPFKNYYRKTGELFAINSWQGAAFESGLDNSPMYDDVPFDGKTHQMRLADVGLISMYIMDSDALADIADELGRRGEAEELRGRADCHRKTLATLWDEGFGLYLNRRTDTK